MGEKPRSTMAAGTVPQKIVETKPMKVCQSAVGAGRPSNMKKRGAFSVASLWEKLTKKPPQERQAAICKLDASSRAELTKYLAARKCQRDTESPISASSTRSGDDSSSSSSSDDSDSSDDDEPDESRGGANVKSHRDPEVASLGPA